MLERKLTFDIELNCNKACSRGGRGTKIYVYLPISAILGHFPILKQQYLKNGLKNKGARNHVLYVVFYKLSYDTSYFSNERI